MNKKGQGIGINVIVVAAIALLVLIVLAYLILNSGGKVNTATTCEPNYGQCMAAFDCQQQGGVVNKVFSCDNPVEVCCLNAKGSE